MDILRRNDEVWAAGEFVQAYAHRVLSPAEVVVLLRHRDELRGRVLELGCGAGRLTGYLIELGGDVLGTDLSPAMVEYCRRTYPGGRFEVHDLRRADELDPASADVVVAANNLLDVLGGDDRAAVLSELSRVLVPGGLLVFSSHNRAFLPRVGSPLQTFRNAGLSQAAGLLPRLPLWIWNHRRLRRHERTGDDTAIVNDEAHDYRLLHLYIRREAQEHQLRDAGFEPVGCLDVNGHDVQPGDDASDSPSLTYLARR